MTYKDKIKQIADQYGAYPQSIQTVEEMAENAEQTCSHKSSLWEKYRL
jgi:hypothetical protein